MQGEKDVDLLALTTQKKERAYEHADIEGQRCLLISIKATVTWSAIRVLERNAATLIDSFAKVNKTLELKSQKKDLEVILIYHFSQYVNGIIPLIIELSVSGLHMGKKTAGTTTEKLQKEAAERKLL